MSKNIIYGKHSVEDAILSMYRKDSNFKSSKEF